MYKRPIQNVFTGKVRLAKQAKLEGRKKEQERFDKIKAILLKNKENAQGLPAENTNVMGWSLDEHNNLVKV